MIDTICYIKNEEDENKLVTSKDQINLIIRKKILRLTGGHENELRNLRLSLVAMWTINNPKLYSKEDVDKAYKIGKKMFELNDKIEEIVQEGKDAKKLI